MKAEAKTIDQMAAGWLSRCERGLSAAEEVEFARWLEADARHAEAYHALRRSWSRLDRLRGSRMADRLEAELLELPLSGQDGRGASARPGWFRLQPWITGVLAASVLAVVAWLQPLRDNGSYAEATATEIGAVRRMNLPDGSVVRLNTNTAIEVVFTKAERRVRLGRGEAFFTIAKNPARPFIVTAAGVDVRAVGTEFDVRMHQEAVEVLVREGKVRVDDANSGQSLLAVPSAPEPATAVVEEVHPILAAGHRVLIPVPAAPTPAAATVAPIPVADTEIERSLAWHNRRLVFESAPLATIVEEFNRYNRHQLVIADAELGARRFGGTFNANDPTTLTELLQSSYDVVVEDRGAETMLRMQR